MINGSFLLIAATVVFFLGYLFYGRYLARKLDLDNSRVTPAHSQNDGVDYVPAKTPVLLGHHFASIAGAAPIIGPVAAAVFGWLPVYLWILLGGVFMGAVHDFTALVASVRHRARSMGRVIQAEVGEFGQRIFLIFAWFALILVVAAFLVIVARTFVARPQVGTCSALFILLAVLFGLALYRYRISLLLLSGIGILLLGLAVYLGIRFPLALPFDLWIWILMIYIFIASITPVWILLQPRDYLNSFLLYFLLIGAFGGILLTRPVVQFTAFRGFKQDIGLLFPILFVTVACGAISGFHSLVASGTTSKQLNRERDAQPVGYGAMLIESLLAVIALITVASLTGGAYTRMIAQQGPVELFAAGIGGFLTVFSIPRDIGVVLTALTVSAFALTSLDTGTRLARLSFQELARSSNSKVGGIFGNRFFATFLSVGCGGALALTGEWRSIWPIFGAANQLLAALALLAVTLWLKSRGTANWFVKIPMVIMFGITTTALVLLIRQNLAAGHHLLAGCALLLLGVALSMVVQVIRKRMGEKGSKVPPSR